MSSQCLASGSAGAPLAEAGASCATSRPFEVACRRGPQARAVDLLAFQHDGEEWTLAAGVVHLAGEWHAADLGARLGEIDALVAQAELTLQQERPVAVHGPGEVLVLGGPGEKACQAGSAQRQLALEGLRIGIAGDDRAVQRQLGAAGEAGAQIPDEQRAVRAGHLDAHGADRLAAEVGLVEGELDVGLRRLGQRLHDGHDEIARRVEGCPAVARSSDAVEVEPSRGKTELDAEGRRPVRRRGAGDELRLAEALKRERNVVETHPARIAGKLRLEIEEGGPVVLAGRIDDGVGLRRRPRGSERGRERHLRRGRLGCRRGRGCGLRAGRQVRGVELDLGGDLAVEARLALEVVHAAVDGVGIALPGAAHGGLEMHGALGIHGVRPDADLAVGALPLGGALEGEGPGDGIGLELAVQSLELRHAASLGALQGDDAVLDLDRLQRNVGRDERQRARRDAEHAPVAAALGVEREAQLGARQLDLVGLDDALEQRRNRQPHGETLGAEERLAGSGGVGDAQLLEAHEGRRQQAHVDVAADPHLTAEDARRLLLEDAAVSVPVDEVGNRKQCRERKRDQAGYVKKPVAHLPLRDPLLRVPLCEKAKQGPRRPLPGNAPYDRLSDDAETGGPRRLQLGYQLIQSSLFATLCLDNDPGLRAQSAGTASGIPGVRRMT